ncbi:MAG TPA: sialidase family protein [Gemmatimonadaceae bacterium]|nr:sialidase family protein [Gemmatimonadaceae bacterium]
MRSRLMAFGSWLFLGGAGLVAACAREESIVLDAARPLSAPTRVGTAPMFAVAADGMRAAAWVSAPAGGTDGRLYVARIAAGDSVAGAPAEVRDALGPVEAHGESPPKIAYGPDGALHAIYVIGKEVPGRRFPVSALRYVRSADGGATWSAPATVTDDTATFGSRNFHALHVGDDGTPYVAWLDGRAGRSAAFVTHSIDGGRSWMPNQRVEAMGEACPCCRTALASRGDTLYVAWRKVFPGSVRDIVVARSTDRGRRWAAPVRVHADGWVFEGCPHAGPAIRTDERGRLHVAWWTGKEGAAGVWYARSDDGGRRFGTPVAIDVAPLARPSHVQLAMGDSGRVVVAWDDMRTAASRVLLRVSRDGGGAFGEAVVVSDPSGARAASFPVLAVRGRHLTVAWSERSAAAAAHAAHTAPDMKDPKARKRLQAVGEDQVLVRTGTMQ